MGPGIASALTGAAKVAAPKQVATNDASTIILISCIGILV
jgi:hypothetical protein